MIQSRQRLSCAGFRGILRSDCMFHKRVHTLYEASQGNQRGPGSRYALPLQQKAGNLEVLSHPRQCFAEGHGKLATVGLQSP